MRVKYLLSALMLFFAFSAFASVEYESPPEDETILNFKLQSLSGDLAFSQIQLNENTEVLPNGQPLEELPEFQQGIHFISFTGKRVEAPPRKLQNAYTYDAEEPPSSDQTLIAVTEPESFDRMVKPPPLIN